MWVGRENLEKFDLYISDISFFKTGRLANSASIKMLEDKIESKVSNDELESIIKQTNEEWNATFKAGYDEGNTKISADGIEIKNGGITIKNKAGQVVFATDKKGNVLINAIGSKFTFTATGQREIEMYADAEGTGDIFTIKVPFYNLDSGFRLCTDTGVKLIEALAKTGATYRMKLCAFETDNIRATYGIIANEIWKYQSEGAYWRAICSSPETYENSEIQRMGVNTKTSDGSRYLQMNCYNGKAFGVDVWSSDVNLKENIVNIDSEPMLIDEKDIETKKVGLELIKEIQHFSFNYKECDKKVDCGYIAQQLKEVDEKLVNTVTQDDNSVLLFPSTTSIIPHITKAIQQQQKYIESLEERLATLEERLETLNDTTESKVMVCQVE